MRETDIFGYQCPNCKIVNPKTSRYCSDCGYWLFDPNNAAEPMDRQDCLEETQKRLAGSKTKKPRKAFRIFLGIFITLFVLYIIGSLSNPIEQEQNTQPKSIAVTKSDISKLVWDTMGTQKKKTDNGIVAGAYNETTGRLDIAYRFYPIIKGPSDPSLDQVLGMSLSPKLKNIFKGSPSVQDIYVLVLLPFVSDGARAWAWQLDSKDEEYYWKTLFIIELSRKKYEANTINSSGSNLTVKADSFFMHYDSIYTDWPNLKPLQQLEKSLK